MKFRVWREGDDYWLEVPPRMLFGREHGRYHRRTFPEIIKLMDFFAGRARTRVLRVVDRA